MDNNKLFPRRRPLHVVYGTVLPCQQWQRQKKRECRGKEKEKTTRPLLSGTSPGFSRGQRLTSRHTFSVPRGTDPSKAPLVERLCRAESPYVEEEILQPSLPGPCIPAHLRLTKGSKPYISAHLRLGQRQRPLPPGTAPAYPMGQTTAFWRTFALPKQTDPYSLAHLRLTQGDRPFECPIC